IDSQQVEWLALEAFNKVAFVRDLCHTGSTPRPPEDEHDDLALVVTQLERLAVNIHALDLRSRLADSQVEHLVESGLGLLPQSLLACQHSFDVAAALVRQRLSIPFRCWILQ